MNDRDRSGGHLVPPPPKCLLRSGSIFEDSEYPKWSRRAAANTARSTRWHQKLRECPLEQLITSGAYASQGRIEPDVGRDADHVVLRASIVAGYAHARECDGEPTGRGEP